MSTPESPEVQQRRDGLFDAIQATLNEQGSNLQVAGESTKQQVLNFDLDDEHWTLTVNKIPD